MLKRKMICGMLISSMCLAPLTGCESLPGEKKTQGAVIGGAGGALAGAAIGRHNRGVGALIGGLLGAGGGYIIGSQVQKNEGNRDEAYRASDRDRDNPPAASEARDARNADLNGDGFVTLNEVVAMQKAGVPSRDMIRRLEDTGQVFALSDEQESYLRDRGVDSEVIRAMRSINQDRARTVSSPADRPDRASDRYDDRRDSDRYDR